MRWHPNKWPNLLSVWSFILLSLFPSLQTHSQCRIVLLIVGQTIDLWILVFLLTNPPTRGHNSLIFRDKKTNNISLKHDEHTRTDLALFYVKYFDFESLFINIRMKLYFHVKNLLVNNCRKRAAQVREVVPHTIV